MAVGPASAWRGAEMEGTGEQDSRWAADDGDARTTGGREAFVRGAAAAEGGMD